jgi:hypothetical protein
MSDYKYEILQCSNRQDIVEIHHEADTVLHIYLMFHIRYFTIFTKGIYVFLIKIFVTWTVSYFAMIGHFPVQ